jgi:hypothetical protein
MMPIGLKRAKSHWYRDGDRNTIFFLASATSRKKVNRIISLDDDAEQGLHNVCSKKLFCSYFTKGRLYIIIVSSF